MFDSYINSDGFNYWLEHDLLKELSPGTLIIIDNARFQPSPRTQELMAAAQCQSIFCLLTLQTLTPLNNRGLSSKLESGALLNKLLIFLRLSISFFPSINKVEILYHHPDPQIQKKMEVLYLKSQEKMEYQEICRQRRISKLTLTAYLKQYRWYRTKSKLNPSLHKTTRHEMSEGRVCSGAYRQPGQTG